VGGVLSSRRRARSTSGPAAAPRRWWYQLKLDDVSDLTGEAALAAAGLTAPVPDSSDWPAFQAVGERLALTDADGVLWHSAARPANRCLCVFASVVDRLQPIDCERLDAPPAPPRRMRT
jgi:hypothetical protein